jgi:hypothetical protein
MPQKISEDKQRIGRACIELKNIQLLRSQTLLILFKTDKFTALVGIMMRYVHTHVPCVKLVTPKKIIKSGRILQRSKVKMIR